MSEGHVSECVRCQQSLTTEPPQCVCHVCEHLHVWDAVALNMSHSGGEELATTSGGGQSGEGTCLDWPRRSCQWTLTVH